LFYIKINQFAKPAEINVNNKKVLVNCKWLQFVSRPKQPRYEYTNNISVRL